MHIDGVRAAGRPSPLRVLVTDIAWPDTRVEESVLAEAGAELVLAQTGTAEELEELARDVDAILTCFGRVTADVLDAAVRCRTVARYGVGVDNIDVARATELGMIVSNVPVYCTDEVADSALLGILALARRLLPLNRDVVDGGWGRTVPGVGVRLRGKVLGLVGLGATAQALAERAHAVGMDVIGLSPSRPRIAGVRLADSLEDLLREADVVSLHLPLNDSTKGIIGAPQLSTMKRTAWLINTARGPLVDAAALLTALEHDDIAGAALDVTDPEPLPVGHPLRSHQHVVLTPHTAFSSDGSLAELARSAASNVVAVLDGRMPGSIVNPQVLTSTALRGPSEASS